MFQQPELGKKIADLRKAKGMTQEELVEKCNLSVRTLQRIEAGEVKPRAYTVKLIWEALELNYNHSVETNPDSRKGLKLRWLGQFYISFIDLFNLKTNAMKKITILSVIATVVVFGIFSLNNESKAQDEKVIVSGSFNGSDNQKEFNGRNVNCTINGVFFKSPMLILDKGTYEFNTYSAKGTLLKNKVEIKQVMYKPENSSDKIEKNGNKLILKGNAKLIFSQNESIEADEIILLID